VEVPSEATAEEEEGSEVQVEGHREEVEAEEEDRREGGRVVRTNLIETVVTITCFRNSLLKQLR